MYTPPSSTGITIDEYRGMLARIGFTQNDAAAFFGVHAVTGRRWALTGPPVAVGKLLRVMLALGITPEMVDEYCA